MTDTTNCDVERGRLSASVADDHQACRTQTTNRLVSILYVSSGVRTFSDGELVGLLARARDSNERSGLTGMLLYRDGNFLQVLEGKEPDVIETYKRIERDPRHRGLLLLKKSSIIERNFPEWQMAFRDVSHEVLNGLEGYSPFMELSFEDDLFRAKPDFAHRMLLTFKKNFR